MVVTERTVPIGVWQHACEQITHPLAVYDREGRFLWCNESFEKLVGYGLSELVQLYWSDITLQIYHGGGYAVLKDLQNGKQQTTAMSLSFRHKLGHDVPVSVVAHRFPRFYDFEAYIAEYVPRGVTASQLEAAYAEIQAAVEKSQTEINERIEAIEANQSKWKRTEVSAGFHLEEKSHSDNKDDHSTSGVSITMGSNGTTWIIYLIVGLLVGAVCYLGYLATWSSHQGGADPPEVESRELPDLPIDVQPD